MDPLNNMCDALVSIHDVLQRRKQKIEDSSNEYIVMKKVDSTRSFGINQDENHLEILTKENFHRAHLYNRNIDELPNINDHDIKRLKLINVYTMQDLLGRYLIHDTPDEFNTFLIKTYQLSENAANTITQLLHHWTRHNLDGIVDKQKTDEINIIN